MNYAYVIFNNNWHDVIVKYYIEYHMYVPLKKKKLKLMNWLGSYKLMNLDLKCQHVCHLKVFKFIFELCKNIKYVDWVHS